MILDSEKRMDRKPTAIQPQAQYDSYKDEIELMDLLKVLWKRKYFIVLGTIVCGVVVAIISFNMTKIYEVNMVVAPGLLKIDDNGKRLYIDSLENIQTMIEGGTFDRQIMEGLDGNLDETAKSRLLNFKLRKPKGLNALSVSLETADKNQGLKILSDLSVLLLEKFNSVVAYYQQEYEIQKEEKINNLEKLNLEASNTKAGIKTDRLEIKNLQERETEIESEIELIGKNTELLISERNKFLSEKMSNETILSALLYSNTIQENISYLNTLRASINSIKSRINEVQLDSQKAENNILNLESQKKLIEEEINNIQFRKDSIQNIQVLKHPKSTPFPIKPNNRMNVLLAGTIGLFLTVFLAFLIEYISRHRNNETNE